MTTPLASIVIPTFNRASTIADAIASCRAQTHPNCEIIVVDDGSTDDTSAMLADLATRGGHVLHVLAQPNRGASAARNAGLDACRGDFVQFLDSDDVIAPTKVARQLAAMSSVPGCDVALAFGRLERPASTEPIGVDCGTSAQAYLPALCSGRVHAVQTAAPLWRREFLKAGRRWRPELSLGDDLEFHVRCMAEAGAVAFVPDELFVVRYHGGDRLSDFSTDDRRLSSLILARQLMFKALHERGLWSRACARSSAGFMRSLYINALRRLDDDTVRRVEKLMFDMGGYSSIGMAARGVAVTRRLLGTTSVLTLADRVRRAQRGLALGSRRRLGQLRRLRVSHGVASLRSIRYANAHRPAPGTILLVEPNEFHSEIIPGYVSLIRAAGFDCWLLARPEANVVGAMSRLPADRQPTILIMNLPAMALFLRSRAARAFELVFFSSAVVASRSGYTGGVLDYMRALPATRLGTVVVEHSYDREQLARDRLRVGPERTFALAPVRTPEAAIEMLAPVEFGAVRRASPPNGTVVFLTVGRLAPEFRNVALLVRAIETLQAEGGRPFKVVAVGTPPNDALPRQVRSHIEFMGYQPFEAMYQWLERAHFFLPLLDSRVTEHRAYLSGTTSGSRQLILGFEKIGIWERPFAEAYGFTEQDSIIYAPGALADGLRAALAATPETFVDKTEAAGRLKRQAFAASLANLRAVLSPHDADRALAST